MTNREQVVFDDLLRALKRLRKQAIMTDDFLECEHSTLRDACLMADKAIEKAEEQSRCA